KGMDPGLVSETDDDADRFFRIYAVSVRNLGTPVYPKRYFEALRSTFGNNCRILTVLKDGKPVSSVLSLYFNRTVMPYYGGGLPEARNLKAYDFMYWELMRRSCGEGMRVFDFGRSIEGTGSFSFKKNWGFEPGRLHYKQLMVQALQAPDIRPGNAKYRAYIKIWQKLPLPVANFIGPLVAKSLA
ncbi:MAG: FemAB family PEP-CTERM system-associated protein, partial [Thiotrichales bacterium]|nr:FemAB family PEP-CTERM system-associated protein [Thiotrichales bacterium]